MLLALLACNAKDAAVPEDSDVWVVPTLTEATATCDAEKAKWTFTATADAWTGNGQVVLSTDGVYVEKHTLYSKEAAADGTSDSLSLSLSVEADWHDVSVGASTVFNCDEPELAGLLRIYTRDGEAEADCRAFGVEPERWVSWEEAIACDTALE